MQVSSEKIWLVKSAGEIKGPFTFDEVVYGLQSKEFIVVDEIAQKFSRWKYLRDEEAFENVVNELKNRDESRGDKTFTNSTTDIMTEDFTDKVLNFSSKSELTSNIEEQTTRKETPTVQEPTEKVKKFVSEKELKRKSRKSFVVQVALIVAIVSLCAIYILQNKKEPTWSFEDLKHQAVAKINYGEYDKAKYYIEKALTLDSSDEGLKYLYAYSSLELDDNVTAQKILLELKTSAKKPETQSQVANLLGIIQLKNFNLEQARENFQKAIDINPKFPQAVYNRGVTYYLENTFDKSLDDFQAALDLRGLDGVVFLSVTENLVHNLQDSIKEESAKMKLLDVKTQIENIIDHIYVNKQELMIALAYLNFELDNKQEMDSWIGRALMVDPQLTNDHVLDVAYYRGLVTWDRLSEWILRMRDANASNNDLKTLYGYAQFRGSEKLKGKDILEGLLKSDYTNVSNQILSAYTLLNLNREDEAKAALQPVMHYQDQILNFYFMGQICLKQNDTDCATTNFQQTLKNDPKNLGALAGMAQVYYNLKDFQKSQEYVSRGMIISPLYRPILSMKEQLESRIQ